MVDDRPPRIAAVVPTIDARTLQQALPWLRLLQQRGVVPVVAANSAETAALPLPPGIIRSVDGTNGGFAHSVNRGARDAGEWDWLVLLNDDLDLRTDTIDAMLEAVRRTSLLRPELLLFDPEPARAVPRSRHALLGLSLLFLIPAALRGSVRRAEGAAPGVLPPGSFKSFSAAALNRSSWQRVGSLSERFLFCYEDVEYVRRFTQRGGVAQAVPLPIQHDRSRSTKSRIRVVLPAITESAIAYARGNGVPDASARTLAVLSLVLRLPLMFLTSAPKGEHVRGIAAGIRVAVTGARASLPAFEADDRR